MDLETDIQLVLLLINIGAVVMNRLKRKKKLRQKRFWMRYWLLRRETEGRGLLNEIEREMRQEDDLYYRRFMRMEIEQFDKILDMIMDDIIKQKTVMRSPINPRMRLAITLRYLATGESYYSIGLAARIHPTTVRRIVKETLTAIRNRLGPIYFQVPSTTEEWEGISKEFYDKWGFPNCCGAMDGKHIAFRPAAADRVHHYNYKSCHSLVLLALVDAKKRIIYADIGKNGRISDGGVFGRSSLNEALENNTLNFPPPKPLPGRRIPMPHVIIADNAFPLRQNILKPYTYHGLSRSQLKFNKALSRARMVVENFFGLLSNRFRVFLSAIDNQDRKFVSLLTYACCILHNFLLEEIPSSYDTDDAPEAPFGNYQQEMDGRYETGKAVRLEFLRFVNEK